MMTNNNNAHPFNVMGGRIITWNPTVSTVHKTHNIYVLWATLLFKGIMEWVAAHANKLFKLMFIEKYHSGNKSKCFICRKA